MGLSFTSDLKNMLPKVGAGAAVYIALLLFALSGQTVPAGEALKNSTQSIGNAASVTLEFAVAVEAGWLHPRTMDEDFWMIYADKNGSMIASPINGLLYMRFTNLSNAPIMIDSYSIELLNDKGEWVKLVTIDGHSGEVYNRGPSEDMRQARRSEIEQDTFDYVIANKNIEPHQTVRGWVFVEAPSAHSENGKEARFSVTDVVGNKAVGSVQVLSEESQSIQPRLLHIGETKDLSQARREFYSEARH
jgi:hypothetical protein